ncbi:hypothetical protein [Pseudomonas syringae]|uniref:DUF2867 domain-containing protein n=5 Tax=Pseudomonas syringae TaxID=317 RepID=A0A3M4KBS4_PSESF|nr:hypothetical protein [Pseudomonas syringae]EPM43630.1 hypothetical protein A246_26383 [Pseudomonas syringae pv. actinidiae ICMP 19098]EPM70319.1 hypothetical protein A249_37934 [Pseudomonas syringae pv. actinidiae ICMP 18804]EPN14615.1 hypothetical protein A248_26016 [Pseudomonas syringae pv. actinidiae ICMP 19100]EPN23103.1 hypothetical protein A247_26309 [Pseudomonas syringae pv. actinidiae ICMP 19099]EPN30640.1 hypothetical protein A243_26916 [Pseudomonas syringae pv. actinidiae ICMP 188
MQLIEKYMPAYEFGETHHIDVTASPERAMSVVLDQRPEEDGFFRFAIRLREFPMRLLGQRPEANPAPFGLDNFTLLERRGNSEVAYGLAGKLWRANYGQATLADAHAFQAFDTFGSVKLVVSFECRLLEAGLTRVVTETRVHCLDKHALRRFTPYWYVIRPVSGIIRRRMLKVIARECRDPRL